MEKKINKVTKIVLYVIVCFVYLLSCFIIVVSNWSRKTFNAELEEIIFTLSNPIKGANTDIVYDALKYCLPRLFVFIALLVIVIVLIQKINKNVYLKIETKKKVKFINLKKFLNIFASSFCLVAFMLSIMHADRNYGLFAYIRKQLSQTTIYEQYYVDPSSVEISLTNENGKKKNLIYIYLESMETTYSSQENGGYQTVDYIPNLAKLAKENISFSNTDKLGGYKNTTGTTWTMGALMATTAGVPFSFPVEQHEMYNRETFAAGITTMGDILEKQGYNQAFLCGSDGEYAGRKSYFEQHGNYEVYDLYTARDEGYIEEDYHVWWGYEDKILYEIAKDKILNLASQEEPFNFTMLTVDTHFVEGYRCELCENEYETETANIVSCADKQVYNFIEWCKTQDFYNDSVIVISGDHQRKDNYLVENVNKSDRTIYNCFINVEKSDIKMTNRIFTPMDMFPTVLSALGFSWEGDRLGLGTNLFSSKKTLAEEIGFDNLSSELAKRSNYYIENFI